MKKNKAVPKLKPIALAIASTLGQPWQPLYAATCTANSDATLRNCIINNAAVAALNDTGITTCSNATQNGLICPVAVFLSQDAEYGTNSFNFTKLDAN